MPFRDRLRSITSGRCISSHPSKQSETSHVIYLVIAYVCVAIALLVPFAQRFFNPEMQGTTLDACCIAFSTITVPLWIRWAYRRYERDAGGFVNLIELYREGMLVVQGNEEHDVSYEDVATLTFDIADIYVNGVLHEKTIIEIEFGDGEILSLPTSLESMRELAGNLQEVTFDSFLRRMQGPFEDGQTIDFGPLIQVRQSDLIVHGELYPWKHVRSCKMEEGQVLIRIKAREISISATQVKNVHVLMHVVHNLAGERAPHDRDLPEDEGSLEERAEDVHDWLQNKSPRETFPVNLSLVVEDGLVALALLALAMYLVLAPPNYFDHPNPEDSTRYLLMMLVGVVLLGFGLFTGAYALAALTAKTRFYKAGFVASFAGMNQGCRWGDVSAMAVDSSSYANPFLRISGSHHVMTITLVDGDIIRLNGYLLTQELIYGLTARNLPRLYRWRTRQPREKS